MDTYQLNFRTRLGFVVHGIIIWSLEPSKHFFPLVHFCRAPFSAVTGDNGAYSQSFKWLYHTV